MHARSPGSISRRRRQRAVTGLLAMSVVAASGLLSAGTASAATVFGATITAISPTKVPAGE
jgi:hypothetical protein